MSTPDDLVCRPEILEEGSSRLRALRDDPGVTVVDRRAAQRDDLAGLRGAGPRDPDARDRWVHYPWRRTVVAVLDAASCRRLRLDRNRNKITAAEQDRLGCLRIGVVGLSVGHAVAHTLALEGLCGTLRLADFDGIEVSNLNRVPATLLDLGVNKAVVAARRIAELDPDLDVEVLPEGVTAENLDAFLDGLDVLVEECDSLDLKVLLREGARRRRVPVIMETSDRGLLDVERFDLEPDRPLFHGLLGDVDSAGLAALSTKDKVPHVLRILGAGELSARMAASMVEIGQTLTTWPQLGGDVALGGAVIAGAVRRLGLGEPLASGRVRLDVDPVLDALERSPEHACGPPGDPTPVAPTVDDADPDAPTTGHPATPAVLEAIRSAPSGGNIQPWWVESGPREVRLHLDRTRTTTMDVAHRGSYVALGAALFNARAAASAAGALGPVTLFPDEAAPDLVATLRLDGGGDDRLTRLAPGLGARGTHRAHGRPRPLDPAVVGTLERAAGAEGGRLHLLGPGTGLEAAGEALAAADRVRYLTDRLHREMFAELVWPGSPVEEGIDVRTLSLDETDLAKLGIASRPEVMSLLTAWEAGAALTEDTRERVASSSALAVVGTPGAAPEDFVRGGAAVEAVWLEAEAAGLSVHPVSPVFLFALDPADRERLAPRFAEELAALSRTFRSVSGLTEGESVALVLRLSHTDATADRVRSRRRSLGEIHRAT